MGVHPPACVPVTPRDAPEAPGPVVRCGNAHRPTQLSQQPSVCYNGSRWSHGETEPGVVTLSWDHVTGGQQGQKEMTESLSLDPMLQTKSLKVGYLRSRIIPPRHRLATWGCLGLGRPMSSGRSQARGLPNLCHRSPRCGSAEGNLTRNHEGMGSILGIAQ